jgi:photosystem II stability/assembly factor-like uncharacterized protein
MKPIIISFFSWLSDFALLLVISVLLSAIQAIEPVNRLTQKNQIFLPILNTYLPQPSALLGFEGGSVLSLAVDPQTPATLYAGTPASGIFKSLNGGQTWQVARDGLNNLVIYSLAVDPKNPATVYAGTYKDGLYKSVDGGKTWFHSNNGVQDQAVVYSIAVDPSDSRRVYIATRGQSNNGSAPWAGILYVSQDGGASWSSSLANITDQDWVYSIAISKQHPNLVMAATHQTNPWVSSDYGKTWDIKIKGIGDGSGRAVLFDPLADGVAYFGVWHRTGVYKSYNYGNFWYIKNNGLAEAKITSMAIAQTPPSAVYAATQDTGLRKSDDGGNTWIATGLPFPKIFTVAVDPTNSAVVYSGTVDNGLHKSIDAGTTWSPSQHGLIQTWVTALLTSPTDKNRLFMSTYGQGIFQSTDRGASWNAINTNLTDLAVHSLVMAPTQSNILFALTDTAGLYRLDLNSSAGWTNLAANTFVAASGWHPAFTTGHPFAIPEKLESDLSPDFTDDRQVAALPTSVPLLEMVFAPSNPSIVYLATGGAGVYKSLDGGSTWNAAGLTGQTVWSITVDGQNADRVYAATNAAGSVKMSQNGGSTWTDSALTGLMVYSLSSSPVETGVIYAGTSWGVFKYNNGKWSVIGLSGQGITLVTVNPSAPDYIYAGTTNGLYFSNNAGTVWLKGPTELTSLTIQAVNFVSGSPYLINICTKYGGALQADLPW